MPLADANRTSGCASTERITGQTNSPLPSSMASKSPSRSPHDHRRRRQARRSAASGCSQRSERVLAAIHAQSRLQEEAAPHLPRQGHALFHPGGAHDPGWDGGPVVLQRRAQPRADRGCDSAPGGGARLLSDLLVRPSARVPAGVATGRACAGRSGSRLLLQFGLGGLRYGAKDRARLSQCARTRLAPAADRPRAGLSRRRLWRHFGRRHGQQPQVLRLAARRRRPFARDL